MTKRLFQNRICHDWTKIHLNDLRYLRLQIHDVPCRSMHPTDFFWKLSTRSPLISRTETWKFHSFSTCFKTSRLFFSITDFFLGRVAKRQNVLSSRRKKMQPPAFLTKGLKVYFCLVEFSFKIHHLVKFPALDLIDDPQMSRFLCKKLLPNTFKGVPYMVPLRRVSIHHPLGFKDGTP